MTAHLTVDQFQDLMRRATQLETELRVALTRIPYATRYKSISPRASALVMARLVAAAASLGHSLIVEMDAQAANTATKAPDAAREPPAASAPPDAPATVESPPAASQEARRPRRTWATRQSRRQPRPA